MADEVKFEILPEKNGIAVKWADGHMSEYNVKWLRFYCHCKQCWRSFSGMYPLDKPKFPDVFTILSANIQDGSLHFTVDHEQFDNHISRIELNWLRKFCSCESCIKNDIERRVRKSEPSVIPRVKYNSVHDTQGMFNFLEHIVESGFCVIEDVPCEDKLVSKLGESIGPICSPMFKEFFQCEYEPNNMPSLPLHQDYPFYEVMPGVLLFHVMKSQKGKGKTIVLDIMEAAEKLRRESFDDFETLTRVPATFECKKSDGSPVWYEIQTPHIELDYYGQIVAVHWNPLFEGPLRIHNEDVPAYMKAYKAFARIISKKENQSHMYLNAGEILVINNHRMAHERNESFCFPGILVQLCYLNIDDLKSKYIVLAHKLGQEVSPIRVGNRSSF